MRRGLRTLLDLSIPVRTTLILLASCFFLPLTCVAQPQQARRVLILNELTPSYAVIDRIDQGIRDGLQKSPYQLEFYYESMDALLFPDPADQKQIQDSYVRKYRNRLPDVVIAIGPHPLQFMLEAHKESFQGVPTVFCLPEGLLPGSPTVDSDFTGVETDFAVSKTLSAALQLEPGTQHVVVVGGTADYDRHREAVVKQELSGYRGHLDISYLTDLALPVLLERLKHLPDHTIVLMISIGRDAAGTQFTSEETGPMITAAADAPVFTLTDLYLGHGEVGGDVADLNRQGKIAAAMALRILAGEKPRDIPYVRDVNTYLFDWKVMQRWGINEKILPPGSVLLNHPPPFWETYKRYATVGVLLLSAQTLLIVGLLWQRARRRKAEADLLKSNRELRRSKEKFSTAFERSPLSVTLTAVQDCRYIDVNETFERTTGWKREEVLGRTPLELGIWREANVAELQGRTSAQGVLQNLEFSFCTKRGETRMGLGSMQLIEIENERCVLSVAADVTEQRRAEQRLQRALREGEERFRLIANSAPVMIWMSDVDKLCTYFNAGWLKFTGRTLADELGNGWSAGVHPDDFERCLQVYSTSFDERIKFEMEYRLRRFDGEYRWIVDSGVPWFDAANVFAGYIGSAFDITELKRSEEFLRDVSGRLIHAQEDERKRIARELHDDLSQRMALIQIGLDEVKHHAANLPGDMRRQLDQTYGQVEEVASSIHNLSHVLHPSRLNTLGLAASLRGLCREVSEQYELIVRFVHRETPSYIPEDVTLCLFRIAQEALRNVVKHSDARNAEVELSGDARHLQLLISDSGCGFDPGADSEYPGLGLVSMRERLRLINGRLCIESAPMHGTQIQVTVPLAEGPVFSNDDGETHRAGAC